MSNPKNRFQSVPGKGVPMAATSSFSVLSTDVALELVNRPRVVRHRLSRAHGVSRADQRV
jgi:hypothetical protein